MWPFIARKILRNRIAFIVVLAMLTSFMGYHASKIELSYEFAKILPSTDSAYTEYNNFKDLFGQDGNIMVIGVQDKDFFTINKFNDWHNLKCDTTK